MRLHSRMALVFTLVATTVVAPTTVTPPKNKYTPEPNVQIEGDLDRLGDRPS